MTKKKDKEVVEEVESWETTKEVKADSPTLVCPTGDIVDAEDLPAAVGEPVGESVDTVIDPATTMKVILDTLERLEGKFDKTFNNHTLIHGRFRRGRKTLNR